MDSNPLFGIAGVIFEGVSFEVIFLEENFAANSVLSQFSKLANDAALIA